MLSLRNSKCSSIILIITTLIGLSCSAGAFATMIIKKYFGIGAYSDPFSCNITNPLQTTYVTTKIVQSPFINYSNAGVIISIVTGIIAILMLVVFRAKLPSDPQKKQEQQQQFHWSNKFHITLYVMFALSAVTLIIPAGYFITFIVEVRSFCSYSLLTEWLIVAGLSAFALIIYLFNIAYLWKISYGLAETNDVEELKQSKEQKVQEKVPQKQQIKEVKYEPQNVIQNTNLQNERKQQQVPTFFNAETFQNQSFKQQNNFVDSFRNQSIRQPLLPHDPSKSRILQDSFESKRLMQLRRQRREQEQMIRDLQRKRQNLLLELNQPNLKNSKAGEVKSIVQIQKPKDKENGNQTIINIHLASSQPSIQPVVPEQPKTKEFPTEEAKKQKIKPQKFKKSKKSRATIYQEESQDESDSYYQKQRRKKYEKQDQKERFQTNNRFKAENLYPQKPSYSMMISNPILPKIEEKPKQNKKLSLSHLHSVQIAPSPQAFSEKLQKPQESQVIQTTISPKPIEKPKNDQSFFQKLLEESQIRQRKVVQFNAPVKKQKHKNLKKTSFEEKKSLDDYIQALNVSMMHMRSAYEQEYVSQKSNYSSVLSNKDFGAIPSENVEKNRLSSFLNKQRLGINIKTLSLSQIQGKIHQKYKNAP